MKILITGGNGFIGSNIARLLLKEGHSVMILSNNSNNIQDLLHIVKYEELNKHLLETQIVEFSPDILIHCAWSGGNSYEKVNSASQFNDNIPLGIYLLESLKKVNKKVKFIGIGSFAEYGNLSEPAEESFQENPINFYGLAKYTFKRLSKIFCEENKIEWMWVRPCYVYGKGDVPTRLIPRLIQKFFNNETVELDECRSIVDYMHIDEFSKIFYLLLINNKVGVFNICSGKQYQLKNIIEIIHKLLGSKSIILYNKEMNRKYSSTYICGNNKKVLDELNINFNSSIEEGLYKTINKI